MGPSVTKFRSIDQNLNQHRFLEKQIFEFNIVISLKTTLDKNNKKTYHDKYKGKNNFYG